MMGSGSIHKLIFILSTMVIFLVSCSGETTPSDPSIPSLLAPANNEPCLDGVSINDSQSTVSFSWSAATDAVTYDVEVEQLLLNTKQSYSATTNELDITLNKAVPYRWKVIANGEPGTTSSESEPWKFYLAGNGAVNYAPFPPELLTPRSASTISVVEGLIPLSWNCNDMENDLATFEVYMDTNNASTQVTVVTYVGETTEIEVSAEPGNIYYWKIIAIDSDENKSSSGVYSFITQ